VIAIVWQFDVKPGKEVEFEQFYGAAGDWTAVSRHSHSYLGSSFLRDQSRASRYLVIEYWSEMLVYEQHQADRSKAIQKLETHRDELVESVEPLGVFTALDVPDRAGPTWSRRH
jgi:quinol monooxygenase YgiN